MKNRKQIGIIKQIYILVVVGLIVMGLITFYSQSRVADRAIRSQSEEFVRETVMDAINAIQEFPGHDWFLKYWYEHADEMDIEYDVDYYTGVETEAKCDLLSERHPGFQPRYARAEELEALPAEDQKLFAEVAYSWVTARLNQIKRDHRIDHLYCVVTEDAESADPFHSQFFLLSATEPEDTRGTGIDDIYPLGVINDVSDRQTVRNSMRNAAVIEDSMKGHFEYSGRYADYYAYVDAFDDKVVLAGGSYSNATLEEMIRSQARVNTGYSLMYEIILIQLLMTHLYLYGIRPLTYVLENIRIYTETKNSGTVTKNLTEYMNGRNAMAIRRNEIGQLSEDFIDLTQEIDHFVDEIEMITASTQRIMTELELASGIQQSMLPSVFPPFPERGEFDLFASMSPAREIGGDFYDFLLLDEDHLALIIADVSGKGVPAALFMILAKNVLESYAKMIESPARILEHTNDAICANNKQGMFVTVWIGILEISTGRLTCSNAGHENPIVREPDGTFAYLSDPHGFVIGGLEHMKYTEYEVMMKPGSKLFVYTDGAREAIDADRNMFGSDGLLRAVNVSRDKSPKEIVETVRAAIDRFVGDEEQFDDTTMLCLEYRGPAQNGEAAGSGIAS